VLHHKSSAAVRLRCLQVLDALGHAYRRSLGGSLRSGYTYVENPTWPFPDGDYLVTLAVDAKRTDTYRGCITIPF
jgi:hypothetical protein